MKSEYKQKLVGALRSGAYRQEFGQLKKTYVDGVICHCALGVLIEQTGAKWMNDGRTWWLPREMNLTLGLYTRKYTCTVPVDLMEETGLTQAEMDEITRWNDAEHLNFGQIAERIEQWS